MAMADYTLSDFAAVTGNAQGGGLFGGRSESDLLALIILFAVFGNGLVGNRGGGYGQGYPMGAGMVGGDALYPWLNQSQQVSGGFRDQMLMSGIQGVSQGVQGLSTQLCGCCGDMQMALATGLAGVNQGMSSGFYQAEIGANNRAMAQMGRDFDGQVANMQGFNGITGQLAGMGAQIASEACADRNAVQVAARDIIASQVAGDQRIMDKLCQLELDGVKAERDAERREIDSLRQQLTAANFAASQVAQNGAIIDGVYNRLATCPVGTQPVYGNQPIFTCPQRQGCGCGCMAA